MNSDFGCDILVLKSLKKGFQETDKLTFLICLILSAIGVVMVASTTHRTLSDGEWISRDAKVMILALILGTVACLVISYIDYDLIFKLWPIVVAASLFLMFLLLQVYL